MQSFFIRIKHILFVSMDGNIVVFDSGVGGLSTLRELVRLLPCEDFVYFADNANAPYGTKSADEVTVCAAACADRYFLLQPKAVMLACNTATSICIGGLRKKYQQAIFVGMRPAIKPAMTERAKKVAVFTTLATAQSAGFNEFAAVFKSADLTVVPLIEGAELVESGCGEERFFNYLCEQLSGVNADDFSGVVLGCTHFVLVKAAFEKFFPAAKIYDGNSGAAAAAKKMLGDAGKLRENGRQGEISFVLTRDNESEREKYLRIFNACKQLSRV